MEDLFFNKRIKNINENLKKILGIFFVLLKVLKSEIGLIDIEIGWD